MARQRGNSWQGSLKTPEKYHRYSFPTEGAALEWEEKARQARKEGDPIPSPEDYAQERPTIRSFFDSHKDVIWPGGVSRSMEANQRGVERVLDPHTALEDITQRMIHEMQATLVRQDLSPSTINIRMSHLNMLLRHARKLEIVWTDIVIPWLPKGNNSRMRFLTEEEERKLLTLLRDWNLEECAEIIEVLIDTGCRPSELLLGETKGKPIEWAEVSVSAGGDAPDVHDPATGQSQAVISLLRTKTGAYRVLPLTERAQQAFLKSKERGDKRPFGQAQTHYLSQQIRTAADVLDMRDVVLYTMRHTCASRLVQRGADLRRVMQWMGHSNINTTLRYAKLTPTDIFNLKDML